MYILKSYENKNSVWEYSGTSLLWTPWGPSKVSCIERCPHFRGKFLLRKHIWDIAKCPLYRGVLITECPLREVPLYIHVFINSDGKESDVFLISHSSFLRFFRGRGCEAAELPCEVRKF